MYTKCLRFNILLSVVCYLDPIQAKIFQTIACFDTKCPVISGGFQNIVRYEDCEPSINRISFCNKDTQYCVNNAMTGKGSCLNIPTEPPPTPRLTNKFQQELAIKISIPLLVFLLVVCVIICRFLSQRTGCFHFNQVYPLPVTPNYPLTPGIDVSASMMIKYNLYGIITEARYKMRRSHSQNLANYSTNCNATVDNCDDVPQFLMV